MMVSATWNKEQNTVKLHMRQEYEVSLFFFLLNNGVGPHVFSKFLVGLGKDTLSGICLLPISYSGSNGISSVSWWKEWD